MDRKLAALAARQDGVVDRRQLASAGLDRVAVRTQIRAGRWTSLGAKVVVLHNGPLTRQQREWAAVLAAGKGAALGGRTALALAGLRGWEDEAVHVVAPRGYTAPKASGLAIITHETRLPAERPLKSVGSPPRTRVERSAVDAAVWSANIRTACGVVAAVVQQRLTTGPRLLTALDEAGAVRHRRTLRLVLQDISGGAQALSEIDFSQLCRRHRLGIVLRQVVRVDGAGRRRYLDVVIESPTGARLACEVDGALHLRALTYWEDMSRSNELVIAGQSVLRFPTLALRIDEALVVDQIRRGLAALEAAA